MLPETSCPSKRELPMNLDRLDRFLETLGLEELPMGLFYTDAEPE
jgi:hypothetical protein